MGKAERNLIRRMMLVVCIVALIAVGFIIDYGLWRPTSDVFILPAGMVWAFRMYYLERAKERGNRAQRKQMII